jgi:hypothetical protein
MRRARGPPERHVRESKEARRGLLQAGLFSSSFFRRRLARFQYLKPFTIATPPPLWDGRFCFSRIAEGTSESGRHVAVVIDVKTDLGGRPVALSGAGDGIDLEDVVTGTDVVEARWLRTGSVLHLPFPVISPVLMVELDAEAVTGHAADALEADHHAVPVPATVPTFLYAGDLRLRSRVDVDGLAVVRLTDRSRGDPGVEAARMKVVTARLPLSRVASARIGELLLSRESRSDLKPSKLPGSGE